MESEVRIRNLAKQIIEAGARYKWLYLYGQPNYHSDNMINHVYTNIISERESEPELSSIEVLHQIFDELFRRDNIILDVHSISFHSYCTSKDTEFQFPSNLGRIMPIVRYCNVTDCSRLSSLSSLVGQFLNINVLNCRRCESITSLASLAFIPEESLLSKVHFEACGLHYNIGNIDDWRDGFIGLGRKRRNSHEEGITLSICNCNLLTHLPSSIKRLGAGDRNIEVNIYLDENDTLQKLPYELGDIQNLASLEINSCPGLTCLPWTLARFPHCSLSVGGEVSAELVQVFQQQCAINSYNPEEHGDLSIPELKPYFQSSRRRFFLGIVQLKILLHREGQLAIDRLYRPGGKGFQRSQDHFQRMARKEFRDGND